MTLTRWLAGIGAMVAVFALVGPAFAYSYSISSGNGSPNGGYGTLDGTLNFTGAKKFDYNGNVKDHCNPAGQGD